MKNQCTRCKITKKYSVTAAKARPYLSRFCITAVLTSLLAACGTVDKVQGLFRVNPIIYGDSAERAKAKEDQDFNAPIVLDVYKFPGQEDNIKTAYNLAVRSKSARNRLQTRIMELSDRVCEQHKGDIVANAALINSSLGVLTSVLSGTSAIVGGQAAKSALAAVAAMTNAGRDTINETFYQQRLVDAIIRSIDGSRKEMEAIIDSKRQSPTPVDDTPNGENGNDKPTVKKSSDSSTVVSDYSVDEAVRDALLYHQRCSFYHGVTVLADAAGKAGTTSEEIQAKMQTTKTEMEKLGTISAKIVDKDGEAIPGREVEYEGYKKTLGELSDHLQKLAIRFRSMK